MAPDHGYRALRKGRRSEAGRVYFITTVAHQRIAWFGDWGVAVAAARCLSAPDTWPGATLLAWVLMPDHWHGLVRLDGDRPLSRVMNTAKSLSARRINATGGRHGRVWQRGYHDRALRRDENVIAAARYLIANPLRAGLVREIGEYPFWSAVWL